MGSVWDKPADRLGALLEGVRTEFEREDERGLMQRAERFLASLDRASQLGMWFDAFAASYPSRIAAAMVYVRELKV
jgi:hypothetical protein